MIDCGRFAENLDAAVVAADHAGFAARREAARQEESCAASASPASWKPRAARPNEGAEIRFDADGKRFAPRRHAIERHGPRERLIAQIAADLLGLPFESFRYVQADTAKVRAGNGHGGARSMHMGGAALCKAVDAMLEKGTAIAARLLQAAPAQVASPTGRFACATIRRVASICCAWPKRRAIRPIWRRGETPGLDTYVWNLLDLITFPNGCHIAEVEVDPETGAVTLERYTAVDDFGTLINPMLTLGQIQGGVAQGIGQAMLEHTVYDPEVRPDAERLVHGLRAAARRRYPAARHHVQRRATAANPLGVKGAGQAGAIAAPQAVVCAVLDALAPLGVTHIDMPLTPERVWRAIRSSKTWIANLRRASRPRTIWTRSRAHGIDYLFVNPGTDFAPIVEAFSRAARSNRKVPLPMVVPHENAALSMAHGYTMVTGRPQAVMLHTNVGTANGINMLIDASRDRIPMLLTSGRTPLTETGAEARAAPTSTGRRRCSTRPACCARW